MKSLSLLVIKPSSLGDIVQALQVVTALKLQRPEIHVTWVVREIFADVVRHCDAVDAIIIFHRQRGLCGLWNCCRCIRAAGEFDAVWDMQGLLRSGIMTLCAKTKRRIGRRDGREFSRWCYSERVGKPAKGIDCHAIHILSEFLPTLNAEKRIPPLSFHLPFLGLPEPKWSPFVLIFPDSRGPRKEWPHFDALTAKLCRENPKIRFIWLGIQSKAHFLADEFPNFLDLQGKTSLMQVIHCVKDSVGVIGNDSGCMHLAAALEKPVLSLFISTDPRRFAPHSLNSRCHMALNPKTCEFVECQRFMRSVDQQGKSFPKKSKNQQNFPLEIT